MNFLKIFSIYLSHPVACCTIYDSQLCSAEMETVSHILSSTHILFYHLWRHLSSPLASKENNFAAIHMKCCKDCFLKFLNPLGFVEFYGLRLVIFVFMYSCKQMSNFFKFLWSAGARNQLIFPSICQNRKWKYSDQIYFFRQGQHCNFQCQTIAIWRVLFSFLQLLFSNTGIASSNSWELLEPEARLFFRQFVIIDGDESLLICHGLKRVDRCSFDHEGRPAWWLL